MLGRPYWEQRAKSCLHLLELLGLTQDRRAQLQLIAAWLLLGVKETRGAFPNLRMRVRFSVDQQELSVVVADRSELRVLREVFVGAEYALPERCDPAIIVDAGSNIGLSVLYFRACFPRARIIAIEPDPDAFARLRENTRALTAVDLVNVALADREGEATLYGGAESWARSLIPGADRPGQESVRTTTLDALSQELSLERIDVLKLDIEGAEVPVLTSSAQLARVGVLIFEYHREYASLTLWELLERLDRFRLRRMAGNSENHATVVLEQRETTVSTSRS
jgi:FkbM family methyltransferase